ncbi:Flp pilus assembly complex ATPase component TadA, partial [bacterium]|nr:Flp pilus assembly complex ATPase component TadA [bacterium]
MDVSLSSSISNVVKEIKNVPGFKKKIENALQKNVTELFAIILGGAISLGASDIHIEPREETVRLRLRIDGILQDVILIGPKIYHSLLSRIKFVSGLKLNVSDRPQDGRFSIIQGERKIETRVSSLPSDFG